MSGTTEDLDADDLDDLATMKADFARNCVTANSCWYVSLNEILYHHAAPIIASYPLPGYHSIVVRAASWVSTP